MRYNDRTGKGDAMSRKGKDDAMDYEDEMKGKGKGDDGKMGYVDEMSYDDYMKDKGAPMGDDEMGYARTKAGSHADDWLWSPATGWQRAREVDAESVAA